MGQKLSVELVDPVETLVVEVDGRDRRAFELLGAKALGVSAGTSLQTATQAYPENYMLWLAWHAARRGGREDLGGWDEFSARVPDMEPEGFDGAGDDLGDPLPAGSLSRLLVELAVATQTTPDAWDRVLEHDPRMISTAVRVLAEQARRR